MTLTKDDLRENFAKANETKSEFVFIGIEAEGVQETICIPERSFDENLEFYERAYSDDLTHNMNKNVFIRGLSFGSSDELKRIG